MAGSTMIDTVLRRHYTEHILQEPINIENETGKHAFPKKWQHLTLKNLSFSYDEKPVLQNISLTIQRGEKIGIVGLSGAGKSTLFKLLMKEHEGYTGDIHFDEVPLRNIEKSSYLQSMAAVLQETEVFNFTLEENITIARAGKNRDRLTKALQVSHVIDFLEKLPSGLKTLIGEKGFRLSGGERQRVGLARAIYKQPQLLLLDEATSHLDLESEKKIQESLHEFFQTVTAIVIAHRLTTIKEMDRIVVIEDGKIVESGSFSTLFKSKGRFYELWEQQKL
jgi:ABC-type multidrug transport system fused ATPase/permease subunit